MCCKTFTQTSHGRSCNCCKGPAVSGPLFWSKKKKIQMAKDSIKCLQSQVKDLEECLQELTEEK